MQQNDSVEIFSGIEDYHGQSGLCLQKVDTVC